MSVSATSSAGSVSKADRNGGVCNARVAIIGAGPAGLYAAQSLSKSGLGVSVDVFDQLPTPYGLVRYGIAPDNQKMKSVTRVLRASFDHGKHVRFIGNVCLGVDISRADLLRNYDAVIYATGAQDERRLGIPGEELPGSYGAKEFINWYNGHPDATGREFQLHEQQVAVIGAGNVALDVARMLVRSPEEVASTDVPDRVLDVFRNSQITDVYLVIRRGPAQVKFTLPELREIGGLANADVVIRPEEMLLIDDDERQISSNRQLQTIVAMLREWSRRPLEGKPRRIHIRFLRRPVRILGENCLKGVVLERNELLPDGQVCGSGCLETLTVGKVFHSVGYRALPLSDVPFDRSVSVIPHIKGHVLDENGQLTEKEYVTGWAKRGPSGTVGTNKSDSAETVRTLLENLTARGAYMGKDPEQIFTLLDDRGVDYVDWAGWLQLDNHEIQLGHRQKRPRVKIPDVHSMLELTRNSKGR